MTDDQFVAAFEGCTIRHEEFHQEDRVRMGFLYMSRFPGLEGIRRFSEGLERLAAASGKRGLYHKTITWVFLLLIRERIARTLQRRGRLPSWDEFATDNKDLLRGKHHVLKEYYRDETLESDLARKTFVLPDRNLVPLQERGCQDE